MRRAVLILAVAVSLAGAAAKEDRPAPDPTTKAKAKELLDGAAEAIAAAQPDIRVEALRRMGDAYQVFDKNRAVEILRQAFQAAQKLPEEQSSYFRSKLQAEIARAMAGIDVETAIKMLFDIPAQAGDYDPRWQALDAIVDELAEHGLHDRAIELIQRAGSTGPFPHYTAVRVPGSLPDGDPRIGALFGAALSAYKAQPISPFVHMLPSWWDKAPRQMAKEAVSAVLDEISRYSEKKEQEASGVATEKGTVTFGTQAEAELFELMHIVQEVDPKRAKELLAKYPDLAGAVKIYPKGTESMAGEGPVWSFTATGDKEFTDGEREQGRLSMMAETLGLQAANTLAKDPARAAELARSIPLPGRRGEILATLARSLAKEHPAMAKPLFEEAWMLLDEVKKAEERVPLWDRLIEAAHAIGDEPLVSRSLDGALANMTELVNRDADVKTPNMLPRPAWRSTQAYCRFMARAARALGAGAEAMLEKVPDPSLSALGRVMMAGELLGRPEGEWLGLEPRRCK
ncbi:MAG: hypothetical protein KIT09_18195 [Bryobacteraceae bacterium]|nr:hypothetical protein [Bryobacteraceae bacterium]